MKIQLPTSLKVLCKQFKANYDLERKSAQVEDMLDFVKNINAKLKGVASYRIQMVYIEGVYSIYFTNIGMTKDPWVFFPGQTKEYVNQMKLEILRELGY
jgi:hypothetical protein